MKSEETYVKIESTGDTTQITLPWLECRMDYIILAYIILAPSVIFAWMPNDREISFIISVFIVFLIVALYSVLNKTEIKINRNELSVSHKPLPWPGNKTLATANIDSFYFTESISITAILLLFKRGKNLLIYHVSVKLKNGKSSIICGLHDENQAKKIKRLLNRKINKTGCKEQTTF